MLIAVISDVHSNFEALTEVLLDIEKNNVDEIINLGDIVGYGPNPVECLDILQSHPKLVRNILGNHDECVIDIKKSNNFNEKARQAIRWSQSKITKENKNIDRDISFLTQSPAWAVRNGRMYCHGSPSDISDYIFPNLINYQNGMNLLFNKFNHQCFIGHTHLPGVFIKNTKDQFEFLTPRDNDNSFWLNFPDEKCIINPGSVGQPRDQDPRASYVIYNTETLNIQYRRIEYDIQKTVDKISEIEDIHISLGLRLLKGT